MARSSLLLADTLSEPPISQPFRESNSHFQLEMKNRLILISTWKWTCLPLRGGSAHRQ
jgi:hypothetical protein